MGAQAQGEVNAPLPQRSHKPHTDGGKSLRDVASPRAGSGASTATETLSAVRPTSGKAKGVSIISGIRVIHESSKTPMSNPAVLPA